MAELDIITSKIIESSIKIHTRLGPGLFESVYEELLDYELRQKGFHVDRQITLPVFYDNILIRKGYRADLIIECQVIVEVKSVDKILGLHKKQLLTYLRLTNLQTGLLINFNEPLLNTGVTRLFNNLAT